MLGNEFFIVGGVILLVFLLIWIGAFNPAVSVGFAFKRANFLLDKKYVQGKGLAFLYDDDFNLFTNKKMNQIWERYLYDVKTGKSKGIFINVNDYFSPDSLVSEHIDMSLLHFFPVVFLAASLLILTSGAVIKNYSDKLESVDMAWIIGIAIAIVFLTVLLAVAARVVIHEAKKRVSEFNRWMSSKFSESPDPERHLQELIITTITKTLHPFMSSISQAVNDFVDVASDKQIEAMENMVLQLASKIEDRFQNQITDISYETQKMAAIQSEITTYLKDASVSNLQASKAVESLSLQLGSLAINSGTNSLSGDIDKVFASFDENLSNISLHLSRSIDELQDALDELPDILRRVN